MIWDQKLELINALLECPSVQSKGSRETIINELPFRDNIKHGETNREHVTNIVTKCLVYQNGLQRFIHILQGVEGDSIPMRKVDELLERIFAQNEPDELDLDEAERFETVESSQERLLDSRTSSEVFLLQQRYKIGKVLEQSHLNTVYIAFDVQLGIRVLIIAYKLQDPTEIAQFVSQASRLVELSHPNLPKVYDHFVIHDGGDYEGQYLVVGFSDGDSLEDLMQSWHRPLSERKALIYIIQICEAIQYLHEQTPPILHLDITPRNIKINQDQARLTSLNTGTPLPITPGYTPIEQHGDVKNTSEVSDVYALGATLYALLIGKSPPDSNQRLDDDKYIPPHKVNREISWPVSEAVTQALELSITKRPISVASWSKTLQSFLDQETETYLKLCSQLEDYLAAGRWLEADDETAKLMLKLAEREKALRSDDIRNFPCIALQVIDGLWERYSEGQFGLGRQKQIWHEITEGATESDNTFFFKFSTRVGWRSSNESLGYNNYLFSSGALDGHLPSLRNIVPNDPAWFAAWRTVFIALLSRAKICLSG